MALINVFDLYAKISLDSSEYDEGLNKASSNTSSFASKLKKGLATAAKAGAAALGAAATGVAALTKASLDQYAEYEQLVGGIETLFKDSSDTVQQYAANAYKTAGVSANSYMEQATAFSASLIQSLGGDTEAAAEYANQAIMDMSDNANKMGTDIESIQQTYQSLMRGNYAMLDNLKLGYGGTKAELERLVADAEKLTGQALDPSKFSDVITAIHAVQENLGITGTTAKEASTTIQGSLNMMQSAWSNLVAGIGNENANMTSLIDNFVESVATVGENILPRMQQIFTGIGTLVQQLAPIIAEAIPGAINGILPGLLNAASTLVTQFVSALPSVLQAVIPAIISFFTQSVPQIVSVIPEIVSTLASTLISSAGPLITAGRNMLTQLATGIRNELPQIASAAPEILSQFLDYVTKNLPLVAGEGVAIINSLVSGIIEAVPAFLEALPQLFESFTSYISTFYPVMLTAGMSILQNLVNGIIQAIPQIALAIPQVFTAITTFITTSLPTILNSGMQILQNLLNGIIQAIPQIAVAIPQVIMAIVNSITTSLPQILQTGVQILQNLIQGIVQTINQLSAAMPQIISTFVSGITSNLPQIIQSGVQMLTSLVSGIVNSIPDLITGLAQVVSSLLDFLISNLPNILQAGVQILQSLISGIIQSIPELVANLPQIINGIVNGIGSLMGSIISIGGDIVRGIWDGISGAAGWLWSQITGWMSGIVNGIKGFFGIHSPSKLFRDEIGKNIGLGVAEGIEDSKDDAVKAAKELAESVYEESKDWIDKQVKYNEYSLREQLEVWETIQAQFIKESKQYADAEDQILDIRHQILEENEKLEQEYLDKFTARSQEIFNVYGLFDKVEEYDAVSGDYLLNNLADQVASIEDYYSKIDQLSQRSGVTEALLDEFRTKGPDAIEALDALLAMSEEKLDQYTALYEEKRALASEIAAKELSGLRESTNDEIEKNLLALQGKFETEGPQVGVSLVQGMANGIRSGKSAVISAVQEVANAAVNAAKSTLGVHSPSTVFAGIGEDMAQGMNVGWNDSLPGVLQSIESSLGRVPATMESPKAEVKPSSANQPAQQAGYTIIQNIQSVPLTPSELARQSVDAYRRLRWA